MGTGVYAGQPMRMSASSLPYSNTTMGAVPVGSLATASGRNLSNFGGSRPGADVDS
jgi:hypothetical protein